MSLPFIPLDQLLLPAPWPALAGLGVVIGTLTVAHRVRRFFGPAEPWMLLAVWVFVVTGICEIIHVSAWMGVGLHTVTRALGAGLLLACGAGAYTAWRERRKPGAIVLFKAWGPLPAVILACLCVAALGPATDGDSLHYHLAVPLRWWSAGQATATPELLAGRLTGLGENLVLLGLGLGSDCVSATFQATAVALFCHAVSATAAKPEQARWMALAAVATPTWLFLVPNQKPQALPAVAVVTAIVLVDRWATRRHPGEALLAAVAVAFAVMCKLSFAADGVILMAVLVPHLWRRHVPAKTLGIAAVAGLLVAAPVVGRNWLVYGDPFAPVLEGLKSHPDPTVLSFLEYLRTYARPTGLGWAQWLIWLAVPLSPANLPLTLGVGVLVIPLAVAQRAWLGIVALLGATASLILGQVMPRYFLVPMLVAIVWLGTQERTPAWLTWLLRLQGVVVFAAAATAAILLGTGALTPQLREWTLLRAASGYDLAKATAAFVPDNALLVTDHRSTAHFRSRTISVSAPEPVVESSVWAAILAEARAYDAVYAAVVDPPYGPVAQALAPCLTEGPGLRVNTLGAARNPFNVVPGPAYAVYRLPLDSPACAALLGRAGSEALPQNGHATPEHQR